MKRRTFLRLAAGAATLPAMSRIGWAQTYPMRPVHLIVGFAAGSTPDIVARLTADWLSAKLGQPFVIENRPGAGGNIAVEAVARAPPDGYTLLLVQTPNVINTYENLSFNFIRDIAPVASLIRGPAVMEVNPSFPAKTVPEFIAYAKGNPGKVNFASVGNGSFPQLAAELFKMMTDVEIVHVPYRGAPAALNDLLGGQVQVYFGAIPGSVQQIKAGKLRALGVTGASRSEALPDIPTVSESLSGYNAVGFNGIGAPKSTPTDIIDKLNKEFNAAIADPKLAARLADLGAEPRSMTSAEFKKFLDEEAEKWAKVVKFAGIKVE